MSAYNLWYGATASLTDIYVYTLENWGQSQADKYLDGIYACFDGIAAKTIIWRPIPAEFEIEGYFTRYEKHYIYWKKLSDNQIGIVAILHERMHRISRLSEAFTPKDNI